MVQGYMCKRLLGLWNLYIMNKALKIQKQPESRAWLLDHDCVKILDVLYKLFPPVYNDCIALDYIFI